MRPHGPLLAFRADHLGDVVTFDGTDLDGEEKCRFPTAADGCNRHYARSMPVKPEDRNAFLAAAMGQYIQRQVNEDDEERAQRKIAGLLNGWREAMANREGIMSRNDGSDLRGDELRVPQLPRERRSRQTQEHPPEHITAPPGLHWLRQTATGALIPGCGS